ncbi:MAG TPA: fructose-6-phosphate aldolase [Candidatus Krumholzibacteria bacterium]|nr:fructose-6-phosphate aldolase [Candidatus Krumholzibacteria bacterium]
MKIFLDTANLDEIRAGAALGVVDGVTTNPSLMAKEDGDYKDMLKEICDIVRGPVSAEVVAEECDEMVRQGRDFARLSDYIVVKIPLIPEGIKAVKKLSAEEIKTNVTLCFSANQGLVAAKAGATYISPFVGRLDDAGNDGMQVVADLVEIYERYAYPTQVLAASIRHPMHVLEAAKLGADVATIPYKIFQQLFKHPLTDVGIAAFNRDWAKVMERRKTNAGR